MLRCFPRWPLPKYHGLYFRPDRKVWIAKCKKTELGFAREADYGPRGAIVKLEWLCLRRCEIAAVACALCIAMRLRDSLVCLHSDAFRRMRIAHIVFVIVLQSCCVVDMPPQTAATTGVKIRSDSSIGHAFGSFWVALAVSQQHKIMSPVPVALAVSSSFSLWPDV